MNVFLITKFDDNSVEIIIESDHPDNLSEIIPHPIKWMPTFRRKIVTSFIISKSKKFEVMRSLESCGYVEISNN